MVSKRVFVATAVALALVAASCGSNADESTADQAAASVDPSVVDSELTLLRDPNVPDLPFPENPDPTKCGIPTQWGEEGQAWLTGVWEGELIQPDVLLYDSHNRLNITGEAAHGAEVQVVLYQENPVLDYYLVDVADGSGTSGWVPAPFLSFEAVV